MTRRPVAWLIALALFVGAGATGFGQSIESRLQKLGLEAAPKPLKPIEFQLKDLTGKEVRLSGLKGKVVLLNFWATWCGPCRSEMPSMQRLYAQLKGQGLEILAVDLQEDKATVARFVKELGLTFPVLLDTAGSVGTQYGARAIPTTYLFDRKGFIFARMVGAREWDTPQVLGIFREILRDGVTYEITPGTP